MDQDKVLRCVMGEHIVIRFDRYVTGKAFSVQSLVASFAILKVSAFASHPFPRAGRALHQFHTLAFAANQESNNCDVDRAPATAITRNALSSFCSRMVSNPEVVG